jgi:hypothetical protein
MAATFPTIFRAGVAVNGDEGLLVKTRLGVGLTPTQQGALSNDEAGFAGHVVINGTATITNAALYVPVGDVTIESGGFGVGLSDTEIGVAAIGTGDALIKTSLGVGYTSEQAGLEFAVAGQSRFAAGGVGIGTTIANTNTLPEGDLVVKSQIGIGNEVPITGDSALTVVGDTRITAGLGVGASDAQAEALDAGEAVFTAGATVGGTAINATNTLHVIGTVGATVDATIGANLDVTTDGTFGSKLAVGQGTTHADNILHVVGRAGVTANLYVGDDLHVAGDLYLTGGLQLPSLQSEVVTLANSMNAGVGNGVSLAGGEVPTSGMLLITVAANNGAIGPTGMFALSKPNVNTAGVVSTLHSGFSPVINALNSDSVSLGMSWNADGNKPILYYESATAVNEGTLAYGVTTLVPSGPSPD